MRVVQVCQQMVAGRKLGYYLLAEEDVEQVRFGVKIEAEDGEQEAISDVTALENRGMELLDLLSRNTVTPVTLRDVVEDWL